MSELPKVAVLSDTCQEFLGRKYYLSGRYFQRKGKLLHRIVWEAAWGPIPHGAHVHHKDGDRANNQSDNLAAVSPAEHLRDHMTPEKRARSSAWMTSIQHLGTPWHRSDDGRAWHSEMMRHAWRDAPARTERCQLCGVEYETRARRSVDPYCSQTCRCKGRWRLKNWGDLHRRP